MKLGPFLGINNRRERHALHVDKEGDFVADSVNVDLDNTGRFSRRPGYTEVAPLSAGRSIFSAAGMTLYADGTDLRSVASFSPFVSASVDTVSSGRVSYAEANGEIYYTDGVHLRRFDGVSHPVGIAVPASLTLGPVAGTLDPARYQVTITYFVGVEEGGALPSQNIELASVGGIELTLPATPAEVTAIGVYLSGPNGEVPLLHSVVSPATTSLTLTSPATLRACRTQFKGPMPAGEVIALFNAKLLIAAGNTLFWSDDYNFGMTSPEKNYLQFPAQVSVVAPCVNGVYIVADQSYWLTGLGTSDMELVPVLPYGAVQGSAGVFPNKEAVYWLGARGIVVGDSQGQASAIQEDDLLLDLTGQGAAILLEGVNRIVATNG